jgi:2-keto-4-pentenoate hydratase/2-oxohepta-3-ene-1,7-dioic acid hydratase in catechol pathway
MTFGVATVVFPGGAHAVPAVVVAGRVSPLGGLLAEGDPASSPRSVRDLVSGGDQWWERIALACGEADPESTWVSMDDVWFVPPLPDPPTIYCAGANYTDHIEEMSRTAPGPTAGAPYHFLVPSGALGGHRQMVWRPPGCTQLDWEVELAVVIGRRTEHVLVGDALEYVAGYTVANDVSMRDFALRDDVPFGVDWLRSKGFATCLPMGPAIIPRMFVPDPQDLRLTLSVNGEMMQDSSTAAMLFSVAEQISALSEIAPLHPGDVICTGTPAGVGFARGRFLEPGDLVIAEIERIGRLESRIGDRAPDEQRTEADAGGP